MLPSSITSLENIDVFKEITRLDIAKFSHNNQGYAFLATRDKDYTALRELAQKGADFNKADDAGMTPLRFVIVYS